MIRCIGPGGISFDVWGLEALKLEPCIMILGTKIEEASNTLKLEGARRTIMLLHYNELCSLAFQNYERARCVPLIAMFQSNLAQCVC